MLRLQKFLAQAGLGSRRSCEQLIKENKIFVNGEIASLGTKVSETDEVIFDNQKVVLKTADLKIIMLNKPPGVLSSLCPIPIALWFLIHKLEYFQKSLLYLP